MTAMKEMSMAATLRARYRPSMVPRERAPRALGSFSRLAISTRPAVTGFSVSGTSILARSRVPGAVMMTAVMRCLASTPKAMYAAMMPPETWAMPLLMTIMTSGMAHVSGGIMAAYIAFGVDAKHLITAVIMTAPGTLLLAKMLVPETENPVTAGRVEMANLEKDPNALGALSRGTIDGLYLALNVAAMLISFIAVIYLCDGILGGLHNFLAHHGFTIFPSSLEQIFGWILAPVAWLIGVPWRDARDVGSLLGTRMVLNELIAYGRLGPMKGVISPRSFTIATYALCGFANFSSIGIQIGGIGALAPNKKDELARLGNRAMLAGTAANLLSAAIVGIMLK